MKNVLFALLFTVIQHHGFSKNTSYVENNNIENTLQAATIIDFDAVYGSGTGSTLVNKINNAVNNANVGDTILFNSNEYDFLGKSLTVTKAVNFKGKAPSTIDVDKVGSNNVTSTFKNLRQFHIRTSDITIQYLKLIANTDTPYVFTRIAHTSFGNSDDEVFFTNILFDNVIFESGRVQVFGGNGAGVNFNQVSFTEFKQGGYYINRKGRITFTPKVLIEKCLFDPLDSAINFDVRGISYDAGNDEFPVVWNHSGTTIHDCLFDGTGVGLSSKGSNMKVTECHFLGYRKDVDMIHIEEFGGDFLIDGNTFEHISPARGIFIDREYQPNGNITITNNIWIGKYEWVISSTGPENLTFEGNNFTNASSNRPNDSNPTKPNHPSFDFNHKHDNEHLYLPFQLPTRGLKFRNNIGITEAKDGFLTYTEVDGDTSNIIEHPTAKISKTTITEGPKAVFDTSIGYRIKNKATGKYLAAQDGNGYLKSNSSTANDQSDVWEFSFKYPYYYSIKNVKTGKYIEVTRGYTLGDIYNLRDDPDYELELIRPTQEYTYAGETDVPFWYFRPHGAGADRFYEFLPGGNERKSRMGLGSFGAQLELAQISNGGLQVVTPTNFSSWILETTGTLWSEDITTKTTNEDFSAYFNTTSKEIIINLPKTTSYSKNISIYDISGKPLFSQQLEAGENVISLNASNISSGVYILKLNSSNYSASKKLIIQ